MCTLQLTEARVQVWIQTVNSAFLLHTVFVSLEVDNLGYPSHPHGVIDRHDRHGTYLQGT